MSSIGGSTVNSHYLGVMGSTGLGVTLPDLNFAVVEGIHRIETGIGVPQDQLPIRKVLNRWSSEIIIEQVVNREKSYEEK